MEPPHPQAVGKEGRSNGSKPWDMMTTERVDALPPPIPDPLMDLRVVEQGCEGV